MYFCVRHIGEYAYIVRDRILVILRQFEKENFPPLPARDAETHIRRACAAETELGQKKFG